MDDVSGKHRVRESPDRNLVSEFLLKGGGIVDIPGKTVQFKYDILGLGQYDVVDLAFYGKPFLSVPGICHVVEDTVE